MTMHASSRRLLVLLVAAAALVAALGRGRAAPTAMNLRVGLPEQLGGHVWRRVSPWAHATAYA
jgi:hypothetical protein